MKIYLVGGAVRDQLLGLEPKDRDYVVVGATPAMMLALGYSQVGASFPVFLHPKTGEEYALARTERKTGAGYNGFDVTFDPSITLEDDLIRRDLTINSMARDMETGELIDPYGGRSDLTAGVLRHTSDAFAEDPVRVLRTARFAARYGYKIADETVELMKKVAPELQFVPQERIFTEIAKGLKEEHAVKMFFALDACEAFDVECMVPYSEYDAIALASCDQHVPVSVKFVFASAGFVEEDYEACCIPTEYTRTSKAYHQYMNQLSGYDRLSPAQRVALFDRLRAFSDTGLLDHTLMTMKVTEDDQHAKLIRSDLAKAKSIDAEAIAKRWTGSGIKTAIAEARANAIA